MTIFSRFRKPLAAFFLCLFTTELITPTVAHALTSGPAQPEMKGFTPIGNTDMVDLFSGDFNYNIPLLDVGGYPVNLSYQSGAGMDDEASWVGLGWSLGPGALNRQLRGIPDDFNGSDKQERTTNMKDHITKGGRVYATLKALGIPLDKIVSKKGNFSLTKISAGVKYDNYRGIGFDLGINAGLSLTDDIAGENNMPGSDEELDLGLNLSSFDGATANINANMIKKWNDGADHAQLSRSIGFGMNSRAGLMDMTLGSSFRTINPRTNDITYSNGSSSSISFNAPTYTPTITHALTNFSGTFSLSTGPKLFVAFGGLGGTGFYSRQTLTEKQKTSPAYGYYHSSKGKDDDEALLDFNREKDIPFSKNVKSVPIPIPTYDLYTASSQNGGGQFRLYSGGSGIFFDQRVHNTSDNGSLAFTIGGGTYFIAGGDFDYQNISTTTKKWTERNRFIPKGDFQTYSAADPLYEPVYFKRVGEPVKLNKSFLDQMKGTQPVAVALPKYQVITEDFLGSEADDMLATSQSVFGEATPLLKKTERDVKNTTFLPLTAKEATEHGLEKMIYSYDTTKLPGCSGSFRTAINRVSSHRKPHHFSEISITGDDGKRTVYGIPVYNISQEEVTFNIDQNHEVRNTGLIPYVDGTDNSVNNRKGRDWYFSREKTPPYSTSHLLTAILSPDYVDRSGDGVTDDDLGTAVKFNYSKLSDPYRWRTPYASSEKIANYNEGMLSDAMDDKASYVYGSKEIWYMHSIESKTMIAHFITENREDGLGVVDSKGVKDESQRLQRLKEIRLYSKSDLKENNYVLANVTPIKVVHFEYDYSLCTGLPNSENNGGKLTLKRVYFTFGKNQKGRLNPYQFSYNTTYNDFDYRQTDRWGTFKQSSENPGTGLNNSEYPYTLQNEITDSYAGNWQLSQIKLPSGGVINVTYESDDYAYVQNHRASEMFMLSGIGSNGVSTGLADAEYIYINTPYGLDPDTFKEKYFDGMKDLYFKFFLDLDNKGHYEFVPGYAKIIDEPVISDGKIKIRVLDKSKEDYNPMALAGWQFIRTILPKYGYPGSETYEGDNGDLKEIVIAMVKAVSSIRELFSGFDKRAKRMKFSDKVNLEKSWVRLCSPHMMKKGGGSRVQKIEITDDWQNMTDDGQVKTATYTQLYDYTIKNKYDENISSGVASYEPMLGNDENPFRQPMRYKENSILGLDNHFYIEEPFAESFFPGASVGYSKVTVRSVGSGDETTVNRTGEVVSEFYTAKDYPTRVSRLYLPEKLPKVGKFLSFIGALATDTRAASQGISVELNDMHGKPKSVNVYNKAHQKISSQEFFYKTENETAVEKTLDNNVSVINADGTVSQELIGMDVEIFNDMREQSTLNIGGSVKVAGGSGAILWFPLPFFFPGLGVNYDKRMFRSSSTVKIVQRFGMQTRVRKMENGSYITTENMMWDAETGNVLLSKTQNEFDDPVYSFAYPAHWKYNGMAQAYKNLGTLLETFTTNSNGEIGNSTYDALLSPGDELIDVNTDDKYWIIRSPISSVTKNRLINADGELQQVTGITVKIIRSGRRNMANTAIGTIVSLKNPILGDSISISPLTKILDAKATVFSEEWSVPGLCTTCPSGYQLSPDGLKCYKDSEPEVDDDIFACYNICAGDTSVVYNSLNALLYEPGYTSSGSGTSDTLTSIFWRYDPNCLLSFAASGSDQNKSSNAAAFAPGGCNVAPERTLLSPLCLGPLNRTGIWLCRDSSGQRTPLDKWIGIDTCIPFPRSGTYYVGLGADDQVRFSIDGNQVVHLSGTSSTNYARWHIYPFTVTAGSHTIRLEGYNSSGKATFGAEIYNNTSGEISAASGYSTLDTIFTTERLVDAIGIQFTVGKYTCSEGNLNTCQYPYVCRQETDVVKIVNPYYKGMLGNWRAKSQYVYQVNRENVAGSEAVLHSTDIRKSGAYSEFNPFWRYDQTSANAWLQNPSADQRWIAANEVTLFNSKGLEVENKDALNRYSSALFGYLESMPVAVASNARYREIAYDGFEDYSFELGCSTDSCRRTHFDFRNVINGSTVQRNSEKSHSGKYSLNLTGAVTVQKTVHTTDPTAFLEFDAGRYSVVANEMAKGFSPMTGKKYVFSFWLKESADTVATTTFEVKINGTSLPISGTKWPIVEGWKRVEGHFTLPTGSSGFILEMIPPGNCYVDDIRIMPFDGQMKTFAYDPSSQRLMAEMDENNFATFYEYDDEGTLIRVKKETERGIMTIRETRSSYRKVYAPVN